MSVIAIKIESDGVHVAADSMLTKDNMKLTNFKKINKLCINNKNIIIGGCGECEEITLMFRFAEVNTPPDPDEFSVLNYLKKFLNFKQKYLTCDEIKNEYVIVVDGVAFQTEGMFVYKIDNYAAIGSGEAFATTALHLGKSAEEAVKVACELCCYASEPIIEIVQEKTK